MVVQGMGASASLTVLALPYRARQGTEKQAVASGKKPYYLKKSEQRRLELVAKYEELKKAGRLDKFMEKRRKKNAAKDHRYVPSQRRPEE